jgi:head-tail adaptor
MSAGPLRERIRFERRAAASGDGYGNFEGAWATLVEAVASRVRPIRGGESVMAARLTGVTTYEITVRSSIATRGVAPGDRAVRESDGATFNIRAIVNPDERDRYIALTCETGAADG